VMAVLVIIAVLIGALLLLTITLTLQLGTTPEGRAKGKVTVVVGTQDDEVELIGM
jgi:hypothetical protein